MNKLSPNCLLDGPIPDPRKKKLTQAEKEHIAHQTTSGGPMTLAWFNGLNCPPAVQKLLSYPESCNLVTENGEIVGKAFTNISSSEWAGEECLLVHSGSYAKLREGVEVGTDITGFITPEMKVIQELCHEWSNFEGRKVDRKVFLMREGESKTYCQVILKKDDEIREEKSFQIPFVELKTFISEATNALLQRIIVQQKKTGEIDLHTLTAKGKIVNCNYRLLGSGYENVKGEDTKVWGIRRTVWADKRTVGFSRPDGGCHESTHDEHLAPKSQGQIYCWDSLYNYYGRLVLRCQPENDHALVSLWFKSVDERDELENFIGVLPPLVWACDMEIHSHFLMKKTELTASYKAYLVDHPQLRALLSDFLQKVLLVKPRGLIDFAKQFFQPFLLARPESAESDRQSSESSSSWDSNGDEGREWDGEGAKRKHHLSLLYPKKAYRAEDYFYNEDTFIVPPREFYALSEDNDEVEIGGEDDMRQPN